MRGPLVVRRGVPGYGEAPGVRGCARGRPGLSGADGLQQEVEVVGGFGGGKGRGREDDDGRGGEDGMAAEGRRQEGRDPAGHGAGGGERAAAAEDGQADAGGAGGGVWWAARAALATVWATWVRSPVAVAAFSSAHRSMVYDTAVARGRSSGLAAAPSWARATKA
ncbi:hypothetical protein [Streptomyces malaysiensis]|uniref:hypothetical protein n=1 Tax=Streptomyces sp. HNM0561 TaxID=2903099 RepID=UPI001E3FCF87|nr:hypothetical protein [Streptomyces sp. HNM0561]UHH16484.1 hypothetical protein LUV23_09130 [Streptomyces sp. HNM0561]